MIKNKGFLLCVPMLFLLNGMNANAALLEEQTLYEKDGLVIIAKEIDTEGIFGPGIQILIENNMEQDVCIQTRNSSVNGYMVEFQMSSEVLAGKKVNDDIIITQSELDAAQIEKISDLEFSFHVFDPNSWETLFDTEMIQLTTTEVDYEQTYDDSGTVLYEENDIKIVSKGINTENLFGSGVTLYIENNSEDPITIQARDVSINGFMMNPLLSAEVMPDKKCISEMTFLDNELEDNGIADIQNIETSFHVFNTETWKTIVDTEALVITLNENGNENSDVSSYEQSDNVLFESNQVKITYQGISNDSLFGPEIMLCIENNSDIPICVQARDTSVDGFMVTPLLSAEVMPGKKSVSSMTFMSTELEQNGISELVNVETAFHIFNNDTWNTIVDSEMIVLELN